MVVGGPVVSYGGGGAVKFVDVGVNFQQRWTPEVLALGPVTRQLTLRRAAVVWRFIGVRIGGGKGCKNPVRHFTGGVGGVKR